MYIEFNNLNCWIMRVFNFIASVVAFIATLFYLILDFPNLDSFNGVIYFLLMIILLVICITGIIFNSPVFPKSIKRMKNSY